MLYFAVVAVLSLVVQPHADVRNVNVRTFSLVVQPHAGVRNVNVRTSRPEMIFEDGSKAANEESDAGLEVAFAKVDTDKSGKISAAEMKAYMYQEGLDDNTIDEMMAAADTNQDGEIDLAEFKLIMRAKPKNM